MARGELHVCFARDGVNDTSVHTFYRWRMHLLSYVKRTAPSGGSAEMIVDTVVR